MNKRGQFYIIAAVIIISVIIGFFTYRNYVNLNSVNTKIYNLGDELKGETGSVYDYGVYNSQDTSKLIQNWTERYYEYSKLNGVIEDWIFVYGDLTNATILSFSTETGGTVGLTGTSPITIEVKKSVKGIGSVKPDNGKVIVKTKEDVEYEINLKEGQNFFFVIKGGEYSSSQ